MKRVSLILALAALLGGCASQPSNKDPNAATIPDYAAADSVEAIPVGVIPQAMIRDAERGRDIEMYIDYPTRGGPHPVIVFSHALGASGRTYVFLTSFLASHGYVVIRPRHADATREGTTTIGDEWENQTRSDWANRVRDIKFVMDSLGALQQQYPELDGRMKVEQIGLAGHSYGAFTVLLAGGVKTFNGAAATSYADPRVKAIVAMSPQGPGDSRGLTMESWNELKAPTLFFTGSNDRGTAEKEGSDWRKVAYELSPAGDKWFISLRGGSQYTFAGRMTPPPVMATSNPSAPTEVDPRTGRPVSTGVTPRPMSATGSNAFIHERQLFNVVRTVTAAFFDTYLKNETKGREYLNRLSQRGDLDIETK